MPNDDDSDDPFFSDDTPRKDRETINAWEIDEHPNWLKQQGYSPGDEMPIRWRDSSGEVQETTITLPQGDWKKQESWSDFYDEMREFYDDIWGDDDGYSGSATAG